MMKEKELRFAVVCYGGVSLAVYMHGITKEFLKVCRASRSYHMIPELEARRHLRFDDTPQRPNDGIDTERVYFELLQAIGAKLDLRILIDVVSGTSAGGINGILLARALAHDLSFDPLRDMWLSKADVSELLSEERRANRWSKWFMRPIVPFLARWGVGGKVRDPEVMDKLSLFVRSQWFREPFDGSALSAILLQGINAMGEPASAKASLVPRGQRLQLFVTCTDFYGYPKFVQIHDPPLVPDWEHSHTIRFDYCAFTDSVETDFGPDNVPGLVFAARATSSFPGIFPAVQVAEIDATVAASGRDWPRRGRFLQRAFRPHFEAGVDPTHSAFIDGSVVNNKPFRRAIKAIRGRPAFRQVDRRIVYIDPHPDRRRHNSVAKAPGFFRVLKGALSDIPRNEPIHDDLVRSQEHNERVLRLKTIVNASRPRVEQIVADLTGENLDGAISVADIARWRAEANRRTALEAGFAYEGYLRLKLTSVIEKVGQLLTGLVGRAEQSAEAVFIRRATAIWAHQAGIDPTKVVAFAQSGEDGRPPPWLRFLLAFDIDFRVRRLRFCIRGLNHLYERIGAMEMNGVTAADLDSLKASLYENLDLYRNYLTRESLDATTLKEAQALLGEALSERALGHPEAAAQRFVAANADRIDALVRRIMAQIDLESVNYLVDEFFANRMGAALRGAARRSMLADYIGFPFWDVLTFSVTSWRDLGEFDEVRIDRVSPTDATFLRSGGAEATLKGVEFNHFGAFLSRAYRENDYLWGRLHAAERIIDLIVDAARIEGAAEGVDVTGLKRKALSAILEAEKPHLATLGPEIAALEAALARR